MFWNRYSLHYVFIIYSNYFGSEWKWGYVVFYLKLATMATNEDNNQLNERKIRFRPPAKVLFRSDSKIEDLLRNENSDETDLRKGLEVQNRSCTIKYYCLLFLDHPSLMSFLKVELTRDYLLENDEERYSARREKIYSFMKIPREVERFMRYGFMQCTDSFLFVYTFLPMRVVLAIWALFTRPFSKCFGYIVFNSVKTKR